MGLFGREKHTRSVYESAVNEAVSAENVVHAPNEAKGIEPGQNSKNTVIINETLGDRDRAKARVEKLYATGQIEATEKNKEYERLLEVAFQARQAAENYKRQHLIPETTAEMMLRAYGG